MGPNKKVCAFRVSTPKKLGRVGRDLFYFILFIFFNKCGLFYKRHLSRYDYILMFLNKFVYVIL